MEEIQEATEISQEQITQQENREEKLDGHIQNYDAKREDTSTIIPIINKEQELFAGEKSVAERISVADDKKMQAGKSSGESKTVDTSKKPKPATKKAQKQSFNKLRTTVPQPFSLATDKRMSRERRASIDLSSITTTQKNMFKESQQQPKLSRSASMNHKPKVPSAELMKDKKTEKGVKADDKAKAKEVQSRYKQQQPVPKIQIGTKSNPRPLPGVGCQRKEAASNDAETNKTEDNVRDRNRVSKTVGDSAKGALSKLMRGTRKAFTTSKNANL